MARTHIFTCLLLVVVALLLAAWIANFFGQFGVGTRSGQFDRHYTFRSGSLSISQHGNFMLQGVFWRAYPAGDPEIGDLTSISARLRFSNSAPGHWGIEVPIILLITALLPLVYGLFSCFRFRLWQFLAFTALVALELAFLLRT